MTLTLSFPPAIKNQRWRAGWSEVKNLNCMLYLQTIEIFANTQNDKIKQVNLL